MSISLTDDHELQVQGYLRFAKLKRDQHVREALATINDFKADRIRPGVRRGRQGCWPWRAACAQGNMSRKAWAIELRAAYL